MGGAMGRWFLCAAGIVLLLSGCLASPTPTVLSPTSSPPVTASPAPTQGPPATATNPAIATPPLEGSATAQDREELAKNEQKWQASGVSRYRIAVHRTNLWMLDQTDTMTVEAGRVTDHTVVCHPPVARNAAQCTPNPRDILDVPALFQSVHDILNDPILAPMVSYDPTYGYPATVSFRSATRNGQIVRTDTFFAQSVREFTLLP